MIDDKHFALLVLSEGDNPELRIGQLTWLRGLTINDLHTPDLAGVVITIDVTAMQVGRFGCFPNVSPGDGT